MSDGQQDRRSFLGRLSLAPERMVEITGPDGRLLARWEGRAWTRWGALARADALRTDRKPARTRRSAR